MTRRVARLFEQFRPDHYDLYLAPDRGDASFSGRVVITGRKTGRPSRRITLHQKGLRVKSAKVTRHDKRSGDIEVEISRINTHKSFDELRLHATETLFPGSYTIEVEFSGKITEPMHGIYPCNFEIKGQKKQLIATQLESHHAREAFPCIDEPEAKAVFGLSLKTPAGETVIANTPVKSEKKIGNTKLTVFEDTPVMSTYLLAFVYGELDYTEAKTKNGVNVRVYSTPDKVELTEFALDVSVRSLEFFEAYFGVDYPLPKLDVIGLPDFSAGAMENWGLMTFREQVLYVDPKSSSIETKQFVAMVVSHEVSHQWFGNLVTMKWWNDLWLNESFANLMEYRAVDELFPEWKIWEEFVYRELGSALSRDALPAVQAVRTEVNHPDELSALFDPSIAYAKGGSLLNMVRWLIGEDAFRAGLKRYFKKHAYSNTEAGDLWRQLGEAGDMDLQSLIANWLERPGFPLVEVDYKPGGKVAKLSQHRLVLGKPPAKSTVWQVPLASSVPLDKPLLGKSGDSFELDSPGVYPLILNHDGHSYFAARYSNPGHFESILAAVENQVLTPTDRLLLVQSYLLLEKACEVPTVDNLGLFKAFAGEREEAVWSILAGIIGNVRALAGKDQAAEKNVNLYVAPLVRPLVEELGWDGKKSDTSHTQKLRALAVSLAAASQIPEVIDEGLRRFKSCKTPSDLAPDIRSAVYYIAVRHGRPADFDKLLSIYKSTNNADEKEEIASELTATRQPQRIKQLADMIIPDVRLQDIPTWFVWLMRNRYATDTAWRWLVENWEWIDEKYGNDKSYDRFPRYAAMALSYPDQLEAYRKFFKSKQSTALSRPIKLGIEEIASRVAWRTKNEQAVKDWLSKNSELPRTKVRGILASGCWSGFAGL